VLYVEVVIVNTSEFAPYSKYHCTKEEDDVVVTSGLCPVINILKSPGLGVFWNGVATTVLELIFETIPLIVLNLVTIGVTVVVDTPLNTLMVLSFSVLNLVGSACKIETLRVVATLIVADNTVNT
jgi:hypothetical protein